MKKKLSKYLEAVEVYREYEYERETNAVNGFPTMVFDCWCKDKDMGQVASKKIYQDLKTIKKGLTEGYSKRGEDLPKSYEKAIEDIEKIIRKVREDFIDFNLSLFLTKIAELKKKEGRE